VRIERFSYHTIQLGPERFRAPEILFNPELIGQEYAGVHQVVVDAINRVDLDLRKSLFSNIVLSGGSTLCRGDINLTLEHRPHIANCPPGFGDRLLNEIKRLALKDVKIKIYAPPERKYSTWIGGSILAGLNAFTKVRERWLQGASSLIPPLDVGISRGIPGRSRRDPQKVWLLDAFWPFLSYSVDSIPSYNIQNTGLAILTHTWIFLNETHTQ